MEEKRICKVEGCGQKHYGWGLCNNHYQRKMVKLGTTTKRKTHTGLVTKYLPARFQSESMSCIGAIIRHA